MSAGRGGPWKAPSPGTGTGWGRKEQHAAGSDAWKGPGNGQGAVLPAHTRLQFHEPKCHVVSAGLPGE